MCYAAPGPRCSGHTKAALDRAAAKAAEAAAVQDDVRDGSSRGQSTDDDYRQSARDYQAAFDLQMLARSRYDATPAGMRELEETAANGGTATRREAERRLAVATATRAEQVAAYKAVHHKDPRAEDENGPDQSHPDPAVAAADDAHAAAVASEARARADYERARDKAKEAAAAANNRQEYDDAQQDDYAAHQDWMDARENTAAAERAARDAREAGTPRGKAVQAVFDKVTARHPDARYVGVENDGDNGRGGMDLRIASVETDDGELDDDDVDALNDDSQDELAALADADPDCGYNATSFARPPARG